MLRMNTHFLMSRRLRALPARLVDTAAAHTHQRRDLYTSRCCLVPATPPRRTVTRGAADSLLSQWSRRRTPAAQTSTTLASASPAAPPASMAPQEEHATGGFSVEELLVFDESNTPFSAESQKRSRTDGPGTAAAKLHTTSRSPEPYTLSDDQDDAVGVEDADGYGMAASADTTRESTLMDDLLRQVSLESEVEDEEAIEASAAALAEENAADPALPTSGIHDAVGDGGDSDSGSGTAESMETAASAEAGNGEEEEEEESMDTVLEEETERMLQAALANMMKESATSTTASAAGSERQQVKGTGGYVFFTREAVLAAAESLVASEETASSPDTLSFDGAAAAVGQSQEDGAGFDEDVVRAAEMESLGLDVETSKR